MEKKVAYETCSLAIDDCKEIQNTWHLECQVVPDLSLIIKSSHKNKEGASRRVPLTLVEDFVSVQGSLTVSF